MRCPEDARVGRSARRCRWVCPGTDPTSIEDWPFIRSRGLVRAWWDGKPLGAGRLHPLPCRRRCGKIVGLRYTTGEIRDLA